MSHADWPLFGDMVDTVHKETLQNECSVFTVFVCLHFSIHMGSDKRLFEIHIFDLMPTGPICSAQGTLPFTSGEWKY